LSLAASSPAVKESLGERVLLTSYSCCKIGVGPSNAALLDNGILITQNNHLGLPFLREDGLSCGAAHDSKPVTRFAQVRCGAIEHDLSRTAFAGNRVSLEAVAIGQVAAEDLLEWEHPDLLHEIRSDREAALVIHVRISDLCPMNLRF
jgi:hypothetical protein